MTENQTSLPISLGEIFRIKREEMGMEIVEIAAHLRVKPSDIEAIEDNVIKRISNHIYVPGLIYSYAKLLWIDNKIIEEQLASLRFKSNVDNKVHVLVNLEEEDNLSPSKNLSFSAMLITIILLSLLLPIYIAHEDKSDLITNEDLILQLSNILPDER